MPNYKPGRNKTGYMRGSVIDLRLRLKLKQVIYTSMYGEIPHRLIKITMYG